MSFSLQLGICHLIAECAQIGGRFDAFQKVAPAALSTGKELALKYHVGTVSELLPCARGVGHNIRALDFGDGMSGFFKLQQVTCFMSIPLLLKQLRVVSVFARLDIGAVQIGNIQRRCMSASHEFHETGCREQKCAVEFSHCRPFAAQNRNLIITLAPLRFPDGIPRLN